MTNEQLKIMANRYSVRGYLDRPIEKEKMDLILEAARIAPTAKDAQPQKVYLLKSPEAIAQIRDITRCAFDAPVVAIVTFDRNKQFYNSYNPEHVSGYQDASIVACHMMLAAYSVGIGTCWVNHFDYEKVAETFGIPENEEVVLIMPMGYQNMEPSPRHYQRINVEDFVKEI